jgi:hypothetical protein
MLTDNSYIIDGVELKTIINLKGVVRKEFNDKLEWETDNTLLFTKTHLPNHDYQLVVRRYLEIRPADNKKIMKVVVCYRNLLRADPLVEATSYFEYTGPAPILLPDKKDLLQSRSNCNNANTTTTTNNNNTITKASDVSFELVLDYVEEEDGQILNDGDDNSNKIKDSFVINNEENKEKKNDINMEENNEEVENNVN